MWRSKLRPWAMSAGVGILVLAAAAPAWTQGPEAVFSLRGDAVLARKLQAARDNLRTESWAEAVPLLQTLLDGKEDALILVKRAAPNGQETTQWTGVRAEAARLLAGLPPRGREFHDLLFGPSARGMLAAATAKGDARLLAEVVRRFPCTDAGAEATRLLGVYHLDRARYTLAAVCFERLLERGNSDRVAPVTLFTAALAFRRAGDGTRAEQVWKRLAVRIPYGLRLGDRTASLAELKQEYDRAVDPAPPALSIASVPPLEARWTRPTAHETLTQLWLREAVRTQEASAEPILSASLPMTVGDKVIYRSHRGIHAVDATTGKELWETSSEWSFDRLASEPRYATHLESWVNGYLEYSPHVLFGNGLVGALSTDGARVYAVDDLAVPPYRHSNRSGGRWRLELDWPDFGPGLTEAAQHSRLLALDAQSGKPVWELGGARVDSDAGELSDSYFLAPPLPLDGRLFVLAEKHGELFLACLDAAGGDLLWKQALAYAPNRLLHDPGRRVQAARPAYGQGVLVCPTNAGVVLGVDVLTPGLAWAYPYRAEASALTVTELSWERRGRQGPTRVTAEWKVPVTIIQGDHVLLTAPDAPSIHCLNLRNGSLLWKASRADNDLYVAGVFAGKVLVVGKQACRALDLASGRQLWRLATGLPSGHGVASGGVYYLPLKEAVREKAPAVYALDVDKGVVLDRAVSPRKDVPGNLVFCRDSVFSQTATTLTAYSRQGAEHEKAKPEINLPEPNRSGSVSGHR